MFAVTYTSLFFSFAFLGVSTFVMLLLVELDTLLNGIDVDGSFGVDMAAVVGVDVDEPSGVAAVVGVDVDGTGTWSSPDVAPSESW